MLFISSVLLALSASTYAKPHARQGPIERCTTVASGYLTDSNGNAFTTDSSSSEIIIQAPPYTDGFFAEFINCSLADSTDYFTAISIPNSQCLLVADYLVDGLTEFRVVAGDCPAQPGVSGSNWKRIVPNVSPTSFGPPPSIYWESPSTTLFGLPNDITVPGPVDLTDSSNAFYLECADVECPAT